MTDQFTTNVELRNREVYLQKLLEGVTLIFFIISISVSIVTVIAIIATHLSLYYYF